MPAAPLRSLVLAGSAGFGLSLLSLLPAGAHQLAGTGLLDGALHPLSGLDHLLLLVAVGALIARVDRMLILPALVGALVGAVFGAGGGWIPAGEMLAALSVSALGLLLLARRLSQGDAGRAISGAIVGSAVAIHALLHGREGSGDPLWWVGTLLAAATVVSLSFLVVSRCQPRIIRALALSLGLAGVVLALFPLG